VVKDVVEDKHMEQQPDQEREEEPLSAEIAESPEAQRIREGIAEALRDGSTIDHETAWLIAKAITPAAAPCTNWR
jgi:hypothetical protein